MEIKITGLTDRHIIVSFVNLTGTFPFMYDRQTTRLSRCTCPHGSLFRGKKPELCYHARLVVDFLRKDCNRRVTP